MKIPTENLAPVAKDDTELLLRASRRGLYFVLVTMLCAGVIILGSILAPRSPMTSWFEKIAWVFPIVVILGSVALRAPFRSRPWNPKSPEVRAVFEDEFRKANLNRAQRIAFVTILITQVPFGLFFASLPSTQAVLGMAVSTVIFGTVVLIACFLFFDRD